MMKLMGMVAGYQVEEMSTQLQELHDVETFIDQSEARPIGQSYIEQLVSSFSFNLFTALLFTPLHVQSANSTCIFQLNDERTGHSTLEWTLDQLDVDAPLFPFYPSQAELFSQFSQDEAITTPEAVSSELPTDAFVSGDVEGEINVLELNVNLF